MIMPLRLKSARPLPNQLKAVRRMPMADLFLDRAKQIVAMRMYDQFYKSGWTTKLAKQARRELVPLIINTVTLVWYKAVQEAAEPA